MARPHNRARNTRRVFQALFFLLFLYLFGKTVFPAESWIPLDLFLRADPLLAISTALSLRSATLALLLFALPVLVLTLLLGRVFCGWMCPLGAVLDFSEKLFRWKRTRPQKNLPDRFPRLRHLKYYLLIGLLTTAVFAGGFRANSEMNLQTSLGLSLVYLLDPIAIITRSLVLGVIAPLQSLLIVIHVDQALAHLAMTNFVLEHTTVRSLLTGVQQALAIRVDIPGARPHALLFYRFAPFAFLIFAAIIALNSLARRCWCRYICPLGALLGVFARWAPVKNRVSDACIDCGLCIRSCRTSAITEDPRIYRTSECVACHECISICPTRAISYTPAGRNIPSGLAPDLSRRRVLHAIGIGVGSVLLLKTEWGVKKTESETLKVSGAGLIRPPGALPEEEFVTACVRCGECMKVCPTNGLQPALGEGGLEALGTPILVPRIGACAHGCASCWKVCPTAAIQPFTEKEKGWIGLGTAVIDHNVCIAWAQDKVCSICDEVCPYDAIRQESPELPVGTRPLLDENKCTGCGLCEKSCPTAPGTAIRVRSFGDTRHLSEAERKERFSANVLRSEQEETGL